MSNRLTEAAGLIMLLLNLNIALENRMNLRRLIFPDAPVYQVFHPSLLRQAEVLFAL